MEKKNIDNNQAEIIEEDAELKSSLDFNKTKTDHIAVLPQQLFRIWIPIDEQKYTAQKINEVRGNIGEVELLVSGSRLPFKI